MSVEHGDLVTGYSDSIQDTVSGPAYYIYSNGVDVSTPDGLVFISKDKIFSVED